MENTVNSKDITIRARSGGMIGAYLSQPVNLPAPGVIVLQEIFGVNGFIRGIADDFADAGYIAIAPQLFWRQQQDVQLDSDSESDLQRAFGFLKNIDERTAIEDGEAALDYLRSLPECTGKVAAMGYCLGGKLAYLMAARSGIDAAIAYYGTGIHTALEEASKLRAPVLLHIAAEDHLCPPAAQTLIIDRMASLRGTLKDEARVHVYDGVDHGFTRKGKKHYDAPIASLADSRTNDFLNTYLRQSGTTN